MMIWITVKTQSEKTNKKWTPIWLKLSKIITRKGSFKRNRDIWVPLLIIRYLQRIIKQCFIPHRIVEKSPPLLKTETPVQIQVNLASQSTETPAKMMNKNCQVLMDPKGCQELETSTRGSSRQPRPIIERNLLSAAKYCRRMRGFLLRLDHLLHIMSLSSFQKWERLTTLLTLQNQYPTLVRYMHRTDN